jgi:hypothetical protein
MQFSLQVGVTEPHNVAVSFDQLWRGRIKVEVDGKPVLSEFHALSLSPTWQCVLELGSLEKVTVSVEKRRRSMFGGLFPNTYKVFVNGSLVLSIKGY